MFLGVTTLRPRTHEKLLLQKYVNNRYWAVICMSMRSSGLSNFEKTLGNSSWTFFEMRIQDSVWSVLRMQLSAMLHILRMSQLPIMTVVININKSFTCSSESSACESCAIGLRGITRKWVGAWGPMSLKATHWKQTDSYKHFEESKTKSQVIRFQYTSLPDRLHK